MNTKTLTTCTCGHLEEPHSSWNISGVTVGLSVDKFITVCNRCADILRDKSHPEFKNVKSLVRQKA